MKTKKSKKTGLLYGIGFLLSVGVMLLLWLNAVISEGAFWIGAIIAALLWIYLLDSRLKTLLFLNFQRHLELKIQNKDWSIEKQFPMGTDIQRWINEYRRSLTCSRASRIWSQAMEEEKSPMLISILEKMYVPVLKLEQGISLCELYYLDVIDVNKSNATSGMVEKTAIFLEFMPVQDLIVNLHYPLFLNTETLECLLRRDKKIGDFEAVCNRFMTSQGEIIASMDVINYLLAGKKIKIPVNDFIKSKELLLPIVFPLPFLAYLIKRETENSLGLKPDSETRKKILDWYVSQKKQDISKEFFLQWPKLTQEEIQVIFKLFDEKIIRDEIFTAHELWQYVSVDALISKIHNDYGSTDDVFVAQITKRLKK